MDSLQDDTTLANIPLDLIRIIIGMVEKPSESLRLISPTWNAMALEYLSYQRHNPPMERVLIRKEKLWRSEEVAMSVYLPMQSKDQFRRFFQGWKVENDIGLVESPPLRLESETSWWQYLMIWSEPSKNENLERLKFIFSRLSSFDRLYLENLSYSTLENVRYALGNVPIKYLVIVEPNCNLAIRKMIIDMPRTHKVEKMIISAELLEENGLIEFFTAVTENATELFILEKGDRNGKIFGHPREFWEKKARDMSDGMIKVEVGDERRFKDYLPCKGLHRFTLKVTV